MDRLPRKVDKTKVAETIAAADKYAAELISDFVRDRLDGNLTKLRDFNLSTLYGDEKYGNWVKRSRESYEPSGRRPPKL